MLVKVVPEALTASASPGAGVADLQFQVVHAGDAGSGELVPCLRGRGVRADRGEHGLSLGRGDLGSQAAGDQAARQGVQAARCLVTQLGQVLVAPGPHLQDSGVVLRPHDPAAG